MLTLLTFLWYTNRRFASIHNISKKCQGSTTSLLTLLKERPRHSNKLKMKHHTSHTFKDVWLTNPDKSITSLLTQTIHLTKGQDVTSNTFKESVLAL